jgi:hypothetical protein
MRKKFAPLALLVGLLSALLLSAVATSANAAPPGHEFKCSNVGSGAVVNVQCVTVLKDVTVTVKNIRALNNNELNILSNNLNNVNVLSHNEIEKVVINTLSGFNIKVDVDKVIVCILAVCK